MTSPALAPKMNTITVTRQAQVTIETPVNFPITISEPQLTELATAAAFAAVKDCQVLNGHQGQPTELWLTTNALGQTVVKASWSVDVDTITVQVEKKTWDGMTSEESQAFSRRVIELMTQDHPLFWPADPTDWGLKVIQLVCQAARQLGQAHRLFPNHHYYQMVDSIGKHLAAEAADKLAWAAGEIPARIKKGDDWVWDEFIAQMDCPETQLTKAQETRFKTTLIARLKQDQDPATVWTTAGIVLADLVAEIAEAQGLQEFMAYGGPLMDIALATVDWLDSFYGPQN